MMPGVADDRASEGNRKDDLGRLGQGLPVGHGAIGLVGLAGFVDGGVKVGPLLELVLGVEQVAPACRQAGVAGSRWAYRA